MARGPKAQPRYQAFTDRWVVKVDKKYVPILDKAGHVIRGNTSASRDLAFECWHRHESRDQAAARGADNDLVDVLDMFLDRVEKRQPSMYPDYRTTFQNWTKWFPRLKVGQLKEDHVHEWFGRNPGWKSSTTQRIHLNRLAKALAWAASPKRGFVPFPHPLHDMEDRPKERRRSANTAVDDATHLFFVANVPPELGQIAIVLRQTGTRPSNVCRVTPRQYDDHRKVWVFEPHNTAAGTTVHKSHHETGEALIVNLTDDVVALCDDAIATNRKTDPQGYLDKPIFRRPNGKPWTSRALSCLFVKYKERFRTAGAPFPETFFPYCYRHEFATRLLMQGNTDANTAALMGHKGTKTLHKNYNHSRTKAARLRQVVTEAMPSIPGESVRRRTGDGDHELPSVAQEKVRGSSDGASGPSEAPEVGPSE